jgi:hypothetical protein
MGMGGQGGLLLQQKLLTSSIPSKDEYLYRMGVQERQNL